MSTHHHTSIEVELSIAVRNLKTSDESAAVDPLCVLFNQPFGRGWQEYARTETQKDNHNPTFQNKIKIPYCFEEQQLLKFQVFDSEGSCPTLSKHTYIGQVECSLARIVSCQIFTADVKLNGSIRGRLSVSVKEIGNNREEVELKFSATHLRRNALPFAHLDPFLEIANSNKSLLRRTTWLTNTKSPTWPSIYVPLRTLNKASNDRSDERKQLNLSCFHHNKDGDHHLLGEVLIYPNELLTAPSTFILKKHGNSLRGELHLISSRVRRVHSFLDYISAGTKLHCTFAVDFTGTIESFNSHSITVVQSVKLEANGDPRSPDSLHHLGSEPTLYEHVLRSFGEALEDYDGAILSLMGFGAQSAPIVHELQVENVTSMVTAYRNCLHSIKLGSASCFTPSIEHVARTARKHAKGGDYYMLVILTCSEISDLNKTIKAVLEAADLPMSIIVVGIGDGEFTTTSMMQTEVKRLCQHGSHIIRDIVQFASFKEYLSKYDDTLGSFYLAKYLLADIPNQLTTYMKLNGLLPKTEKILPCVK